MPNFNSIRDYWNFSQAVRNRERFIYSASVIEFLEALKDSVKGRIEELKAGYNLYRAQNGFKDTIVDAGGIERVVPFEKSRMLPLRDRAAEGRANPPGIPTLYSAVLKDTAMCEIRPWLGSLVSVCRLRTLRPLRIANCTEESPGTIIWLWNTPSQQDIDLAVWRDIDRAFSTPVERDDMVPSYVPTQIIADLLRSEGYDGVAYMSSLGKGHNLALFNIDDVKVEEVWVEEVKDIDFSFEQYPLQ